MHGRTHLPSTDTDKEVGNDQGPLTLIKEFIRNMLAACGFSHYSNNTLSMNPLGVPEGVPSHHASIFPMVIITT